MILRVFVLLLLLIWAAPLGAEEASSGDLLEQETLSGSWGGLRPELADAGVILGGDEILDALGDVGGGRKQGAAFAGRFELFANIDLAEAAGWQGAILHANAYQIHGKGLSTDDIGNILTVSNIGATPSTRLFALWLQQSLFDERVSVRLGQIAADDEFFVSQYAGLFINATFGWPAILGINLPSGGPAYPLATPGIRLKVALSPALVASAGLFNGDPAPKGPGDPQARDPSGTDFRTDGGLFWIGELAYAATPAIGGEAVPGSYKLGGWYHNDAFADQRFDAHGLSLANPASNGVPLSHHGDFGVYAIMDQLLLRTSGTSDKGLGVFLRAGASPGNRNLIQFHADTGLSFAGLGRGNDVAGFGVSYEGVSDARRALSRDAALFSGQAVPPADFESALEFSYQAQIAPWWIAQPDMQLVLHPGARLSGTQRNAPGNALVLGLRTAVSF
jgi:porin